MALEKVVYTAHATTVGGRGDGTVRSSDGMLDAKIAHPKEMGGNGQGTNPEQLFAAGYSACFLGAMKFVAGQQKLSLPRESSIAAEVDFGPRVGGGFGVGVRMKIDVPGLDKAQVQELVDAAHQVCPYSNATRGNIDVAFTLA
jgi:osmotically inducible protein OsmC